MILAVDVHYRASNAVVAGVLFEHWEADAPNTELTVTVPLATAAYEPGQFYKRELPCVLALLRHLAQEPDYILVDGYVSLGSDGRPGLGQHVYEALQGRVVIIGVAKSRFKDTPSTTEVLRGDSQRALYVTAVGITTMEAKNYVTRMHGAHRLPTLLKRVDHLSRTPIFGIP